ncbi:MAG: NERD domain-containing protein [Gammaproteobacteria bacterium]|nr:NERD domain-containing protein [Gammaproteobacteria bacterium]
MAVLIPDVPKNCPNSERYVYERLGRELPEPWIVLHSLGLAGHESKIWGEADIVILSELGVFALEVKGGNVDCVNGVWTYSGDFGTFTKRESPWTQAMGSLGAIREQLRNAKPAFHNVLFGFGVVMPYTAFTARGPEIIPEILLDRRSFRQTLSQYVKSLEKYWKTEYLRKHKREYRGLTATELQEARQILRPDVETALSLGGYLTGLDDRLVQLTNEQIRASRRMTANPRTVVRGAAGTGKSIIALDRALQLGGEGRQVLYLCFNRLLAAHVRMGLERTLDEHLVQVHPVHELYRKLIEDAGLLSRLHSLDEGASDFFSKRFPELAAEALCEIPQNDWDVLVVDEAQDLLTPEHMDVFDLLLRGGMSRGCWHLFLDPQQNIYGEATQTEINDRLDDYTPAFDDLYENCRNTRQVAVQTSIVSGIDLPVTGAPDGPEAEVHYYPTPEAAVEVLSTLIRQLVASQVRPEDITILSTRRPENSLLAGHRNLAGYRLVQPDENGPPRPGELLFSTMHAFKGLERQAVIAIDMAEIGDDCWSMLHYTGLSRARVLLHFLLPTKTEKQYERQARSFGRRLQAV